jgi:hypothetical protein
MSDISKSEMGENFSQEFLERLNACETPEEVAMLFRNYAVDEGYGVRDIDPSVIHPTGKKAPTLSRVVEIGGQRYELQAANEEELKQSELELYRRSFTQPQQQQTQQTQQRDAQGRFVAEPEQQLTETQLMDLQEAKLKHLSGELSDREFADVVLANQGVNPDTLREIVEAHTNEKFQQSWANAIEEFRNGPLGADWPGGNRNREALTSLLEQAGLMDAEDKVEALAKTYAYMKQNNMLFENEEIAAEVAAEKTENALGTAQTQEELDRLLDAYRHQPKGSSGFWGR